MSSAMDSHIHIDLPMAQIAAFCQRWQITEFALFGSVLRDDFRPDSEIDVLVTFAPDSQRSLHDLIEMQDNIEAICGRWVDLLDRRSVEQSENYIRRNAIMKSLHEISVARYPAYLLDMLLAAKSALRAGLRSRTIQAGSALPGCFRTYS